MELGGGPNDGLGRRQLCRVEEQNFDKRADLGKAKVPKVEYISGAGLLNQLSSLPPELCLRVTDSLQTWVDETSMVKALTELLQVLIVNASATMWRDELEGPASDGRQRDPEGKGADLAAYPALRWRDGPDVPRSNPKGIRQLLRCALQVTNKKARVVQGHRSRYRHGIPQREFVFASRSP